MSRVLLGSCWRQSIRGRRFSEKLRQASSATARVGGWRRFHRDGGPQHLRRGQFVDFVHARQRNLTLDDLNRLRVLSFLDDQSNIYDLHHELTTLQRRVVGGQQDATAAMFCRLAVSRSDSAVIGYDRARILALACYHQRQSAPRTIVSDMTEASLLLQYNRKRHLDSVTKLVENLAAKMQQIGNVEVGSLCSSVVSSSIYLPIRTTVGKAVQMDNS